MRKLAFVGASTLSNFYKDVLRRRMALLFMLLALMSSRSGGQHAQGSGKDLGTRKDGRPALNKMLWNADTLGVVLALHILWLARFLAMLVDDILVDAGVDRRATTNNRQGAAQFMILVLLASVAASALFLRPYTAVVAWLGVPHNARLSAEAIRATQAVRTLELSVTLVSLLGPLCKLPLKPVRFIVPRSVLLPSPSHAPKLADILPLASGLGAVLPPRVPDDMGRSGRNQTPVRVRRHRLFAPRLHLDERAEASVTTRDGVAIPPDTQTDTWRTTAAGTGGPGLRQPLQYVGTDGKRAPRQHGVRVRVDTTWLLEHLVTLYGHLIGALNFVVVLLSMPSLSPASFPLLFAELGAVTSAWTTLRQAIECLEFVRRRFGSQDTPPQQSIQQRPAPINDGEDEAEEQMCAMCFEPVLLESETGNEEQAVNNAMQDCCTLDCGHQLHAICLVQWLTKQSFCPCCHAGLTATPPGGLAAATARPTASNVDVPDVDPPSTM